MPAGVAERPHLAVVAAHHDDRRAGSVARDVGAASGNAAAGQNGVGEAPQQVELRGERLSER